MKFEEKYLIQKSKEMRKDILDLCYRSGSQKAHLGGCMSLVEILAVLYLSVMDLNTVHTPAWEQRDRLILSKGHGALAMYAALKQAGVITPEELKKPIRGQDTFMFRHPKRNVEKGIEFSGGSLGMGLGYGIGECLAFLRKGNHSSKTYVIIGDGECDEGAVWESAALAGHLRLKNLAVIIDKNGLQLDGFTKDILCMDNMEERWRAFGFHSMTVDGHDCRQLYEALTMERDKPLAVIANTIKGKGISFAENQKCWHDNYLSEQLYRRGLQDIGVEE